MKILFLGTGAADYKIDQRVPGEEFRRYSSALITSDNGEKLLIDPGPHIFDYTEMNDCPDLFDGLTGIIVTPSAVVTALPITVSAVTSPRIFVNALSIIRSIGCSS